MKKALSVLLSVLMIFSVIGFAVSAEETDPSEYVTVKFYNYDGTLLSEISVLPGTTELIRGNIPENPERAADDTAEYLFKGWVCNLDGETYYQNTVLVAVTGLEAGDVVEFHADYSATKKTTTQSFWKFVESVFERINLIFAYFAKIFEW